MMSIKYNKATLNNLEQIFNESDFSIRYERGQFKSGYCILNERKIIVINKFFDVKGRIDSLLDILGYVNITEKLLSDRSKAFLQIVEKNTIKINKVA